MAIAAGRVDNPSYSDINMTPLIDIMLVLLIIFITESRASGDRTRSDRSIDRL